VPPLPPFFELQRVRAVEYTRTVFAPGGRIRSFRKALQSAWAL